MTRPSADQVHAEVIKALRANGPLILDDLARVLGWSGESARNTKLNRLKRLARRGAICHVQRHSAAGVYYLHGQQEAAVEIARAQEAKRLQMLRDGRSTSAAARSRSNWRKVRALLVHGPCAVTYLAQHTGLAVHCVRTLLKSKLRAYKIRKGFLGARGRSTAIYFLPEHKHVADTLVSPRLLRAHQESHLASLEAARRARRAAKARATGEDVAPAEGGEKETPQGRLLRKIPEGRYGVTNGQLLLEAKVFTKRELQQHLTQWQEQGLVEEVRPGRWVKGSGRKQHGRLS